VSKLYRILPLLVLVCLCSACPLFADTLQVTFSAGDFDTLGETISGSFLWDTQTNVVSNVAITSSGPFAFLSTIQFDGFAPLGNPYNYPAGSLIFMGSLDVTNTVSWQMNYADHVFLDPPIVPAPGVYSGVPFDLGGAGVGRNVPGTGEVTVTAVPEPGTALLFGLGVLALGASLAIKKFRW
jgi:hypothetical protein